MTESVRIHVAGTLRIVGAPPRTVERLRRALRVKNPEYVNRQRMDRFLGSTPEWLDGVAELPDGSCETARGTVAVVKDALARDGLKPEFVDERASGSPLGETRHVDLRDYQREGVSRIQKALQGLIVIACGGGKTRLGIGAIEALGRTAIVMVHTDDLADQWDADVREYLGLDVGHVRGGRVELDAPITIGMVWSLLPLLEREPQLARRWGTAIVDEAHHAPSETFTRGLARIPARWRVGLTATPDREDGLDATHVFGPVLLEVDTAELVARRVLLRPETHRVPTAFTFVPPDGCPEQKRLHAMNEALIADDERAGQIADLAVAEYREGQCVLVLSTSVPYALKLGRMCWERGAEAITLVGGAGAKRRRRETLGRMREGTCRLVIATTIADEGLDVQRLSSVVLAWPERARSRTQQRVGRVMRSFPGKRPRLFDVIDDNVPTLSRRAEERWRTYRAIGIVR